MYNYFDIHSHVNDKRFGDDRKSVLARMTELNIGAFVVGTDKTMSQDAIDLAEKDTNLWAVVGQHPVDMPDEIFDLELYKKMASHPRVVAIGECGLDYYWPSHDKWPKGEAVEKERQHELFEQQIALALTVNKPLMIHGRSTPKTMDAYIDILAILKQHSNIRGNVHFFAGNIDIAKQFFDLGFTISFTGVITFSHDYDDVIKYAPLESMMTETDCPYVTPALYRGKRNEPAYVVEVAKQIAAIRGEAAAKVSEQMVKNALHYFEIEKSL